MEEQADPAEAGSGGGNDVGLCEDLTSARGAVAHTHGPCDANNAFSTSANSLEDGLTAASAGK